MAWAANSTGGYVIKEGLLPVKITLTDTCNAGDLIGYDAISSNVWERADADAKVYAQLIAGEKCTASGNTIQCYKMAIVSGFTGGTAGHLLWLSTTAGAIVAEPVSNYHQCVGQMVSDTEAVIRTDAIPQMGYACETTSTGMAEAGFFRAELFNGVGASMFGAIKAETKVAATADTVSSARGLYLYHQILKATTAAEDSCIIRLEDGSTNTYTNAYFELACTSGQGPTYLIYCYQGTATASRTLGTCSTQSGWFKCSVGGSDRYIALYTTVA